MRGYSQHIVERNAEADPENLGVLLGKLCIHLKYPAAKVANELGISRQAVYHYFLGRVKPQKDREIQIIELIHKLKTF